MFGGDSKSKTSLLCMQWPPLFGECGGITAAGWALACSMGRPGKPVTMEAVT